MAAWQVWDNVERRRLDEAYAPLTGWDMASNGGPGMPPETEEKKTRKRRLSDRSLRLSTKALSIDRNPETGSITSYAVRLGPGTGTCGSFNDPQFRTSLLPLRGRPYPPAAIAEAGPASE